MATIAAPALSGSRASQVSQIANWLDRMSSTVQTFPGTPAPLMSYGNEFRNFAANNPSGTATQAFLAFELSAAGQAMITDIGTALGPGQATIIQDFGSGIAAGAQSAAAPARLLASPLGGLAAIGDFFQRLGQANTWIRVGQAVLGIILLGVGIAHITGAENAVSKAVKTGSKVALLA